MKKQKVVVLLVIALVTILSIGFCLSGCKKNNSKDNENPPVVNGENLKDDEDDAEDNDSKDDDSKDDDSKDDDSKDDDSKDDDSKDDDSKDNNKDSNGKDNNKKPGTTTTVSAKAYVAPEGYHNYMKDASRVVSYYDFKGTLSSQKTTVDVTATGGPAIVGNVFMDPEQTYVVRATVSPKTDDALARIIFKGPSAWTHLYLGISQGKISIHSTMGGLYPSNGFIATEISDDYFDVDLDFKAGTKHDIVILSKPGYVSVWVNGKLCIDNLNVNKLSWKKKVYDKIAIDIDEMTIEKRFDTSENVIGFYCAQGTAKFSNLKAYYTVAGMDKNYIDDGKDTNYKSSWKQDKFYLAGFIHHGHCVNKESTVISLAKNAGINLILPYADDYESLDRIVKACENQDVDYMVNLQGVSVGSKMINEEKIAALVKRYKSKSHNIGYYIQDEPSIDKMWYVRKLAQMFNKYDSKRTTYTCLLPSYGPYEWTSDTDPYNKYVDKFMSKVKPQILSMDYYPFQQHGIDVNMKTNQFYKDLGYMRKTSLKNDVEYWQAVSAQNNWENGDASKMTAERVALQTNAAICYGASSVSHFTLQEAYATSKVTSGKVVKGPHYDDLAAYNKKSLNAGQLLFGGTSKELYHSDISTSQSALYFANSANKGVCTGSSVLSKIASSSSKAGLIVGVFEKSGAKYVVAVNKDYTAKCTATITLKNTYKVSAFNAGTNKMGTAESTSTIKGTIEAGGIAIWKIG